MSGAAITLSTVRERQRVRSRPADFITIDLAGVDWLVREDLADALLPAMSNPRALPQTLGVEIVKTGPHRTVCRMALDGRGYYFKHFRVGDLRAQLQNLVRASKAEREFEAARGIARLGLPTFEAVALGLSRRAGIGIVGDSFLISREIPEARPLDQFVNEEVGARNGQDSSTTRNRRQSALRQSLARELGELAAKLHQAGVDHADFHAANVLTGVGMDGAPKFWLIDLHRVRFQRALSKRRKLSSLTGLHQLFAGKSSRTDRLRFYRAYQRHSRQEISISTNAKLPGERSEIERLERALAAGAAQGWRRADRAWRRGNRHVRKLESCRAHCRGLATLDPTWLQTIGDDPEGLFRENLVRWHKLTAKHRVAEVRLPVESPCAIPTATVAFMKCIEKRAGWRSWLGALRDSPVRRSWELGHALLRRGIDTPRPLMFVEQKEDATARFYLLTEAIPDSLSVPQFLHDRWPAMSPGARREWVSGHARELARQLRRLHEAGFDHRDLKFANLLVADDINDRRIWFLDLDGVRVWRMLPSRRAVQNLARINTSALVIGLASRTDRLRFLRWYLEDTRRPVWKWWWRRVETVSLAKIRKNRVRGRVLS